MSETAKAPAQVRELALVHRQTSALAGPWLVLINAFRCRFLLWSLVQRDLRVKYRNSVLGYFWSLVEPLLLTGVYYVLFSVIAKKPDPEYPLWVVIGVLIWQMFGKILTGSVTCLTGNAGLIKQIYFPREIFALARAGAGLAVGALSLIIVVPFLIYYGATPSWHFVFVPIGMILTATLTVGMGLAMCSANAVQRDIEHLFAFIIRAGMFLSPVLWTLEQIPKSREKILDILLYNPMVVPISMVRSGLQGIPLSDRLSSGDIVYSVSFCLGSFVIGAMVFKRFEGEVVKHL